MHHGAALAALQLQVSGYVREVCQQMTQTVPKAIVHCMVLQVRLGLAGRVVAAYVSLWQGCLVLTCCPSVLRCVIRRSALPSHPAPQAKDKLLEEMQASVAGDQEVALKRLLGEDEAVMKRREALTHKLDMLSRAQAELTSVDV